MKTGSPLGAVVALLAALGACSDVTQTPREAPPPGPSWQLQESGTESDLTGIAFADTDHGFAVGANGTVLKTVNGGETWTPVDAGTTEELRGVAMSSPTTAIVVGRKGVLLTTDDGGDTWTQHDVAPLDNKGEPLYFEEPCFVSPDTIFVGGDDGLIVRSVDAGVTWSEVHPARSGEIFDLAFNGRLGAAAGYTYRPPPEKFDYGTILITEDAGSTWTLRVVAPFGSGDAPRAVYPITAERMFAVLGFDSLLTTTDGWNTWTSVKLLSAMDMDMSGDVGYAVGTQAVHVTSNAGVTWTESTAPQKHWRTVFMLDERHTWIAGYNGRIARWR